MLNDKRKWGRACQTTTYLNANQEFLHHGRWYFGKVTGCSNRCIENVHIASNTDLFFFQTNIASHQHQFHAVVNVWGSHIFVDTTQNANTSSVCSESGQDWALPKWNETYRTQSLAPSSLIRTNNSERKLTPLWKFQLIPDGQHHDWQRIQEQHYALCNTCLTSSWLSPSWICSRARMYANDHRLLGVDEMSVIFD